MSDNKRDKEVEDAVLAFDEEHSAQKKGLVAVIEGDNTKISFVNMEASDALAVIAGIIIEVSKSTGVPPSHIQKDIKSFVKSAIKEKENKKDE